MKIETINILKRTDQLSETEKNNIYLLKASHWSYEIKSQIEWFKKNIISSDLHNMLIIDNNLVGYTALRKKKCRLKLKKLISNEKILIFDTYIIKDEFRKKGFGTKLIKSNNKVIRDTNLMSFLLCDENMINFYKKNGWKFLKSDQFQLINHKYNSNGMIFNFEKDNTLIDGSDFKIEIFY